MKGTLELTGMEFHSFHGCLPEERDRGNTFVVDLSARYDVSRAALSDDLSDVPDYSGIYDLVAERMAEPSNLIENVAARIASCVAAAFPELEDLKVSVAKKNPPVAGKAAWSRFTVEYDKD